MSRFHKTILLLFLFALPSIAQTDLTTTAVVSDSLVQDEAPQIEYTLTRKTYEIASIEVEGADSYIIQFAKDADMQQIVFAQELTETSFVTTNRLNLNYLPLGEYYWRVKTRIPNAGDTWSEVQKITLSLEDAVENIVVDKEGTAKWIEDGQVYIEREGVTYNMQGNIVK